MPGIVYVVATPIGNLEDLTLRAIRTLRECSLVAAEDTRRTAKLLNHLGLTTPATSLHAHNEDRKIPALLARLDAGERIAIVTDAGTPTISDPGNRLVSAAASRGHAIVPVPGPSAVAAALSISGFWTTEFSFRGFPPRGAKDRKSWLMTIADCPQPSVFFEAPHRILQTLRESASLFGCRPICLCRELTKVHEEVLRGTAEELAERIANPKGEFTVVVGPAQKPLLAGKSPNNEDGLLVDFWQLTESGQVTARDAVSTLAKKYGVSKQKVYRTVRLSEKSGE